MAERPRDRFRTVQVGDPEVSAWPVPKRVGLPDPHDASAAYGALAGAARATPCAGRHEWTSDLPEERQEAALLCHGCPAWAPCTTVGAEEPWGVWAGSDRAEPEAVAERRLRGLGRRRGLTAP